MKKQSPMQMKKPAAKAAAKSAPTKKSAPAPVGTIAARDNYDAQYDLDTLTRAEAIRNDAKRHAAAMNEAKKRQQQLATVMGKKKA